MTPNRERSLYRPICLLFFVVAFFESAVQLVAGQKSTALQTHITKPDLSNPNTAIILVVFLILFPTYIIGFILLWKRRKHFPIAGRGSIYLLFFSVLFFIHCICCSVSGFLFPLGIPCGIEFFLHFCFSIPTAVVYMVRGWTLVFRLEIMNYLAETRWRQEKRKMMQGLEELQQQATETNEAGGSGDNGNENGEDRPVSPLPPTETVVNIGKPESGVTKILVQSTSSSKNEKEVMEDDPTTIPGYFFIHHRRWIEPGFLFPFLTGFGVLVMIAMIIVGVYDPDIRLTNENWHREGVLPDGVDYTTNQFLPDTWLSSPVCLSYSVKLFVFEFILSTALMPFLAWCIWRIYLDKQRQCERKKDQAECYKLVHGKEPDVETTGKSIGGLSLDDSQNVKSELAIIIVMVFGVSGTYYPIEMYIPGYTVILLEFAYIFMFTLSIANPLYLSYAVSRKHREMIDRSKSACNVNSLKKPGEKDGMFNRLPHQRPYFTLKYILHQSHTYDVLLAFLQKEYSSENALFWSEARSFEKAAKELEAKIPTWPSSMDPDEEQTTHGSGGGGFGSTLGSRARAGSGDRTVLRKSSNGAPPPQRATNLPSPMRVSHLTQHTSIDTQLSPNNQRHDSIDADLPDLALASQKNGSIAGGLSPVATTIPSATLSPTHLPLSPLSPSLAVTVSPTGPEVALPPMSPTLTVDTKSSPKHAHLRVTNSSSNGSPSSVNSKGKQLTFPLSSQTSQGSTIQLVSAPVIDFASLHSEADRLKAWAEKMNENYLKRSAILEINIPEDLNKLVQSQLAQLSSWSPTPLTQVTGDLDYSTYPVPPPFPLSTLYKQTQLAVFDLIQRDSFRRFILTPGFQQLLHQADEEELARLEKQNDLIMDTAEVVDKAMQALSSTPIVTSNGVPSQQRHSGVIPASSLAVGGSIVGNAGASRQRPPVDDSAAVEEDEPVYNLPGTPSRATNLKPKNVVRVSSTYQRVIEEGEGSGDETSQQHPSQLQLLNPTRGASGSPTLVPGSNTLGGMAMNTDVRGSISMLGSDPQPFSLGPRAEHAESISSVPISNIQS